ncbi:MAG: phosphonate ABC transporter, permease protein PhnE [Pseudomonadota bacterium]
MAITINESDVARGALSPEVAAQLKPDWRITIAYAAAALLLALLLGGSYYPAEVNNWTSLITDSDNMATYMADFFPPNFERRDFYIEKMLETIYIAFWGTVLSIVFGIPFALLSSSNIAPWWILQPVRRLMDACRAINELVFALLFVVAVGLGPFAGVMALFVHNLGIISKLFSEAVEAIDPRPVEGIRSTGASRLQEILYGVIPQVLPLWSSLSLYRFETNVRSATVLGIVGAGGIGQTFYDTFRSFKYTEVTAMIIIIVIAVILIDIVSAQLRRYLV